MVKVRQYHMTLQVLKVSGTHLRQTQANNECKPNSRVYFDAVQLQKSDDWRRSVVCLSKYQEVFHLQTALALAKLP